MWRLLVLGALLSILLSVAWAQDDVYEGGYFIDDQTLLPTMTPTATRTGVGSPTPTGTPTVGPSPTRGRPAPIMFQ